MNLVEINNDCCCEVFARFFLRGSPKFFHRRSFRPLPVLAPKKMSTTKTKGVTVRDVAANQFITEYAAHLKRNQWLKLPAWIDLVKTGVAKELSPLDPDWYYVRAGMSFSSSFVHR